MITLHEDPLAWICAYSHDGALWAADYPAEWSHEMRHCYQSSLMLFRQIQISAPALNTIGSAVLSEEKQGRSQQVALLLVVSSDELWQNGLSAT